MRTAQIGAAPMVDTRSMDAWTYVQLIIQAIKRAFKKTFTWTIFPLYFEAGDEKCSQNHSCCSDIELETDKPLGYSKNEIPYHMCATNDAP